MAIAALAYLATAALFVGPVWLINSDSRSRYEELARHGVLGTALVTSTDPANHNSICFTFIANGRSWADCGGADRGELASQLHPGDAAEILYSSADPSTHCVCYLSDLYANGYVAPLAVPPFFALIAPGWVLLAAYGVGRSERGPGPD